MEDKQISSAVVLAGVLWGTALTLMLAGTAILVASPESFQARSVGLACYAAELLSVGAATCLTVRVMLHRQTKLFIDAVFVVKSGEAERIRRMR